MIDCFCQTIKSDVRCAIGSEVVPNGDDPDVEKTKGRPHDLCFQLMPSSCPDRPQYCR